MIAGGVPSKRDHVVFPHPMSTYPASPKTATSGVNYFRRLLDKIRLQARGDLGEAYQRNLGSPRAADGALCNFLRVPYEKLRERVLQGGSDEESSSGVSRTAAGRTKAISWSGMVLPPRSVSAIS